ncbi:MAG TPA: heparinase II/III family protein, partial [Longimicrobiales bacterium]|nr:heparinase II/III family protein [Longimicrobiales bacterium]
MAELDRIAGALRLGPVDAARLAGWKAWQSGMRGLELRTGHGGYHAVAAAYGERWAKRWGAEGVVGWLHRAGGGRLFLDCSDAAEWGRTTCTQADLELAESSAAGVFDLIGSGPRSLGVPPSWRTDLYSGLEWPLEQSHGLRFVRGDGSDIRTVWELSRGYHFIALARAYWSTGDVRFVHAFITHVDSWIEQNPFGRGPHWASPMDAAVRAANWTLGLLLFAPVGELDAAFVQRLLSNLYATGLHVERHREWHPVYRGNHYVANGVGLAYLGALFRGERLGERWLRRGTRIIADELLRQVHPDGVSFEASLGYHRFATQLFSWGAALVRANAPGRWTRAHDERLAAMYDFIETYLPESGLAPLLGDNDDGHLHVMDA